MPNAQLRHHIDALPDELLKLESKWLSSEDHLG